MGPLLQNSQDVYVGDYCSLAGELNKEEIKRLESGYAMNRPAPYPGNPGTNYNPSLLERQ